MRKKLAEAGRAPRSAPPLRPEHIIEHGKAFLRTPDVDIQYIMPHAIMLTTRNTGMRYDGAGKLTMDLLSVSKYDVEL